MLSDTLRHFCRNIKEIKSVDGVPMEKNRIEVNIDDLKQKYNELDNHLKNIPGEFVFNVDESGCSEWIDAQAIKVLVPSDLHTHTVCVPYYKAAPYNISHTKIFLMAIFTLIFFL